MNVELNTKICPKCQSVIEPTAPGGLCPRCLMEFVAYSTGGVSANLDRDPPDVQTVQAAFPNLEILELIGSGGMGVVFKARQPKLDRWVALKILPAGLASEPLFAERFEREGRLLARLNHPNIVAVYDFGNQNGFYFLIMEYVDGVNLRQAYATARFTQSQSLTLIPKICEALQFAHDEGVLHRDIKPENILLDSKGRLKIADFGIAKFLGTDDRTGLTATGATIGTPHYMAPEQVEHPADVDHRADIFSLGVVFYEMLTGSLPLGRFPAPSESSSVDSRIDRVVMRALERDRERRQQSANEVRTQVESLNRNETKIEGFADASAEPSHVNGLAWGWRAYAGLFLTVISLAGAILPMLREGTVGKSSIPYAVFSILVFFAFGLPGTILGWLHIYDVRQSGDKRGLYASIPAAMLWPIALFMILLTSLTVLVLESLSIARSSLPEQVWLAMFLAVSLVVSLLVFRGTKNWASQGTADPHFLKKFHQRWYTSSAAIGLAAIVWCYFGWTALISLDRSILAVRERTQAVERMHQASNPNILSSVRITDIDIKGNVLLVTLSPVDDPSTFVVQYQGPPLIPKSANAATEEQIANTHFPNEFLDKTFRIDETVSEVQLAFAMPSEEAALACGHKLLRLGKERNPDRTIGMGIPLFEISDERGSYSAMLQPSVASPNADQQATGSNE